MSDYRVTVKVRNARMLRAIESISHNPSSFAKAYGLQPTNLCALVAMKIAPTMANGDWRREVIALCEAVGCEPRDLFTERQMDRIERNVVEREVDEAALIAITGHTATSEDMAAITDARRLLEAAVSQLPERDADVIRGRFSGATLDDMAREHGVTRERIRQRETKAINRLRNMLRAHEQSLLGLKWEAAR